MRSFVFAVLVLLLGLVAICFAELPDSLNMHLVGTWYPPSGVELGSVVAQNGYAYVSALNKIYVLDISTPSSPTLADSIEDSGDWSRMALSDSFLFAGGSRFRSIDLYSNPLEIAGTLDVMLGGRLNYSESERKIFSRGTVPIEVIDVSDPTAPYHDTTYSISGVVAVHDSLLYIGYSHFEYGMEYADYRVWNVSNPDDPEQIYSHNFGPIDYEGSRVSAITADAYGAYMFVEWDYGPDFFYFHACDRSDTLIGYSAVSTMTMYQDYLIINGRAHGEGRISVWQTFSGCSLELKAHYHWGSSNNAVGTCIDDSLYILYCTPSGVAIFKVDSVVLQVCELKEKYRHDDFRIYPNPLGFGEKAYVYGGDATIYDIRGQKMGHITPEKPLDINGYPPGLYLAVSADGKSMAKFVVIR